jgi:uncharacterized protein
LVAKTTFAFPAKAGTQFALPGWLPAFAGMTVMLFALLLAIPAAAQTFPKLTGRVVDQAHLLTPAQIVDISSKSEALEAASGRQFVVATVNSLEGRPIEDYGYRLGRAWGIGQEGKDDGVILLVAPNERKVRIETGYGARVFLTDAVSSVIIRESILPAFKAGDMGAGIVAGSDKIIGMMQLPPEEAARRAQEIGAAETRRGSEEVNFFPVVLIVIFFFMIVGSIARRAGGRRYRGRGGINPWIVLWGLNEISRASRRGGGGWGGGSWGGGGGGGGFGGFSGGGGSFGGGGASGGW